MELCLIYLSSGGGGRPTLPELLQLNIPKGIGTKYNTFGVLLLNDETGSQMDSIADECRGKPERICHRILQEWLEGKGLPVTWETLIQTLRDTGLPTLADHIHTENEVCNAVRVTEQFQTTSNEAYNVVGVPEQFQTTSNEAYNAVRVQDPEQLQTTSNEAYNAVRVPEQLQTTSNEAYNAARVPEQFQTTSNEAYNVVRVPEQFQTTSNEAYNVVRVPEQLQTTSNEAYNAARVPEQFQTTSNEAYNAVRVPDPEQFQTISNEAYNVVSEAERTAEDEYEVAQDLLPSTSPQPTTTADEDHGQ